MSEKPRNNKFIPLKGSGSTEVALNFMLRLLVLLLFSTHCVFQPLTGKGELVSVSDLFTRNALRFDDDDWWRKLKIYSDKLVRSKVFHHYIS